ncbi:MAG: hypothetical protein KAT68_05460 [Bacteroidales bacterium]|nr:hypothetical protein [Bacteroidales bacterium]
MESVINNIEQLIEKSEILLTKKKLTFSELNIFKKESNKMFLFIKEQNYNYTINDIVNRGLDFKVKRIKNPVFQWIYNLLTEARDDITYNAPFLKKRTDSDYYKTYIFRTIQTMNGLIFNLKLL